MSPSVTLPATTKRRTSDPFPDSNITILDTSDLKPRNVGGFNEVHFNLVKTLFARRAMRANSDVSREIISPYRKQAKAYDDWINADGIASIKTSVAKASARLLPSFVCFDTVEANGSGNDKRPHLKTDEYLYGLRVFDNLMRIFGRTEVICVVVMDVSYVRKHLTSGCLLRRMATWSPKFMAAEALDDIGSNPRSTSAWMRGLGLGLLL